MNLVALGDVIHPAGRKAGAETDYPVYSVTKHAGFVPSLHYFKKQVFSRELSAYKLVEPGDFAYATIHLDEGSVGIAPERALISPMYTAFRIDRDRVDARYLMHYLKSGVALSRYATLGRGSAHRRRSILLADFAALPLPLPPLDEQRKMAAVLDRAQKLVQRRQLLCAVADTLVQSVFRGKFGDPISNSHELPLTTLDQLGTLDRGVSRHRPRNDPALLGGRHPLIQTGEVASSGGFIRDYTSTYSDFGLAQSRKWPAGTLCITIAANIAKTGILTFDACFPDSVVGFRSDQHTTSYVRVWFSFLQATLEASAPQSAQKNINLSMLRSLPVPVPPAGQLVAFGHELEAVDARRAEVRNALASTQGLALALQTRAFSGQL